MLVYVGEGAGQLDAADGARDEGDELADAQPAAGPHVLIEDRHPEGDADQRVAEGEGRLDGDQRAGLQGGLQQEQRTDAGDGGRESGILSSLLLGAATGLLWAPCAGPILGLVLTGAAISGPNTRTTQLFINLNNNAPLDASGFAPFGTITDGMDVVDKIFPGYAERPDQQRITEEGDAYLVKNFPMIDKIKLAKVLPAEPAAAPAAK